MVPTMKVYFHVMEAVLVKKNCVLSFYLKQTILTNYKAFSMIKLTVECTHYGCLGHRQNRWGRFSRNLTSQCRCVRFDYHQFQHGTLLKAHLNSFFLDMPARGHLLQL